MNKKRPSWKFEKLNHKTKAKTQSKQRQNRKIRSVLVLFCTLKMHSNELRDRLSFTRISLVYTLQKNNLIYKHILHAPNYLISKRRKNNTQNHFTTFFRKVVNLIYYFRSNNIIIPFVNKKKHYNSSKNNNDKKIWKLGIRSKNQLIRGDQSHCPLAGVPFKVRASSVWT